jgi:hypothetical protein
VNSLGVWLFRRLIANYGVAKIGCRVFASGYHYAYETTYGAKMKLKAYMQSLCVRLSLRIRNCSHIVTEATIL